MNTTSTKGVIKVYTLLNRRQCATLEREREKERKRKNQHVVKLNSVTTTQFIVTIHACMMFSLFYSVYVSLWHYCPIAAFVDALSHIIETSGEKKIIINKFHVCLCLALTWPASPHSLLRLTWERMKKKERKKEEKTIESLQPIEAGRRLVTVAWIRIMLLQDGHEFSKRVRVIHHHLAWT